MNSALPPLVRRSIFLTLVCAAVVAQEPVPVALSGQPAPGTAEGVSFASFTGPRLDAAGRVAFYAVLAGAPTATNHGLWSQADGRLQLVVRKGDPAPGTNGAHFSQVFVGSSNPPALGLDSVGHIAFRALLAGGGVCDCDGNGVLDNHTGWWSNGSGQLALIARADDQAPSLPAGVTFDTIQGSPIASANGALAQLFVFKGAGVNFFNTEGIMSDASGNLTLVARSGDPVPGLSPGTTFGFFGRPFVGPAGEVSFFSNLDGPAVTQNNDDSLWALRDGTLKLLVRQGDPAPGGDVFGSGASLSMFTDFSVRGGDKLAFSCLLAGGSGIFSDASGKLLAVVHSGDAAPGLAAGTKFQTFGAFTQDGPLQLDDFGHVAFMARLNTSPPSDQSLWLADPVEGLVLLARGGDSPPDAPPGITFTTNLPVIFPIFGAPAMNAAGQVVFDALLAGPGLPPGTARGLYATDASGVLRKLVQPGDTVQGHVVSTVAFNKDAITLESYNGPTLNDQGRIVFRLVFTDGTSGVFTLDLGPWVDLGSALGGMHLAASGTLLAGQPGTVALSQAAPDAAALLFVSLTSTPTPFKGGTLLPLPALLVVALATDGAGSIELPFLGPSGVSPGTTLFLQFAIQDAVAPQGVALSNALQATFP